MLEVLLAALVVLDLPTLALAARRLDNPPRLYDCRYGKPAIKSFSKIMSHSAVQSASRPVNHPSNQPSYKPASYSSIQSSIKTEFQPISQSSHFKILKLKWL